MNVSCLKGELETVVIRVAIVVELQDMVIERVARRINITAPEWLSGAIARVIANWTRIEIALVDQVVFECFYVSDVHRSLAG